MPGAIVRLKRRLMAKPLERLPTDTHTRGWVNSGELFYRVYTSIIQPQHLLAIDVGDEAQVIVFLPPRIAMIRELT